MKQTVTRRNFIKGSTAVGTGLILGAPSILSAAAKQAASDEIRVGFIGCGKQHEVLFNAMKNIPGLRYTAVCDIMKDRVGGAASRMKSTFKLDYIPTRYIDAEDMLTKEKDLDAVVVATPDFWHAPHTIMALEAGCHVYCEKMMSNTIDGAREMVRASERTGKLCQIGHQRRSNPRYLYALKELIQRHKICGQIVNANGQWNRAVASSRDIGGDLMNDPKKRRILPRDSVLKKYGFKDLHQFFNWRFYRDLSGGPISDLGAHQIDIFNWFFGSQPKSVMASGGRNYFKEREHFDNVMCIFEYDTPEGGARAFYQVLTTTSSGGGYFESFMGTEGTIEISERAAFTNLFRENSAPSWDPLVARGFIKKGAGTAPAAADSSAIAAYESAPPDKFMLPGDLNKPPHQPHLENFFASVRGEAKLNCDARHAFESEAPIYWVNPSALANQTITFTEEHLSV
ncbi:MAG: Gfo/Idh/MocA family oxidoreductase [Verrucomicrobia bacterium]|jgi:predicted dehydrogenase|nr:Gfo/Idh/MocA family oxidoreductase [Verrucomicrobiota bacterium]MBT7069094.1 Gfo/Idh/MocA family oxidoreductase [Verrucomicrobiota bacterium]